VIPFVDLKAQYQSIKAEIDHAISTVVNDCHFILGSEVEEFEREFAKYVGVEHAVGTNNGTSALHLALLAAGVQPGDEVITVSCTFVATAAAVRYTNARPVYVDVTDDSYTMDPSQIERAITARTRVIMPVHLYGQCADMDPIIDIARRHGLTVVEDAAQAHGAAYKGRGAGSIGDLACFSFYPGKNLGAYGEGGAVVTNNADYAQRIKLLRDHGQSRKYHHELLGYNYRMEGIQGAVLRVKLRHLNDWNAARRTHAARYRTLLTKEIGLLGEMSYGTPVYHVFPVFVERRDELQQHLTASGISTGIHYPIPVHRQPAFADDGRSHYLPVTERASAQTLSLPMYAELSESDIASVAHAVNQFRPEKASK
jgi:dTDP-4-amino-4,6-dideoxygalactose transaminase